MRPLVEKTWVSGLICPECNGGKSKERSCSAYVASVNPLDLTPTKIFWRCHRNSCGKHGYAKPQDFEDYFNFETVFGDPSLRPLGKPRFDSGALPRRVLRAGIGSLILGRPVGNEGHELTQARTGDSIGVGAPRPKAASRWKRRRLRDEEKEKIIKGCGISNIVLSTNNCFAFDRMFYVNDSSNELIGYVTYLAVPCYSAQSFINCTFATYDPQMVVLKKIGYNIEIKSNDKLIDEFIKSRIVNAPKSMKFYANEDFDFLRKGADAVACFPNRYKSNGVIDALVIVEDVLSAMRLSQDVKMSVALLGTHFPEETASMITEHLVPIVGGLGADGHDGGSKAGGIVVPFVGTRGTFPPVVLSLDTDATAKAAMYAAKYGIKLVTLARHDVKNMSASEYSTYLRIVETVVR